MEPVQQETEQASTPGAPGRALLQPQPWGSATCALVEVSAVQVALPGGFRGACMGRSHPALGGLLGTRGAAQAPMNSSDKGEVSRPPRALRGQLPG